MGNFTYKNSCTPAGDFVPIILYIKVLILKSWGTVGYGFSQVGAGFSRIFYVYDKVPN